MQVGGSGSWAVQAPPEQLALVLADTQTLAEWTLTAYWEGLQTLLSFLPAQVRFCRPEKGRHAHQHTLKLPHKVMLGAPWQLT